MLDQKILVSYEEDTFLIFWKNDRNGISVRETFSDLSEIGWKEKE